MDQGPEWFDEGWVRRFAGLDARLDLAEVDGLFMVPWGWDTHWVRLRQWLVYHIDQGHARLTTRAGAPQELSPGDLVCLPAGLEFRVTAQRPATTVRIRRFRFSRPDAHPMPLLVPGCSHVASLIDELIEECGLEAEPLHPERVAAL
ncbi:MAG: cupin domain-containing protein, partial [Planctomycetota bacterium]